MGEVRRSMEDTGTWETTTVFVTSDHWWKTGVQGSSSQPSSTSAEEDGSRGRSDSQRVGVLAKRTRVRVQVKDRNADALLALLRGKVCTPNSVVSWIDQQRSIARSPHNRKR